MTDQQKFLASLGSKQSNTLTFVEAQGGLTLHGSRCELCVDFAGCIKNPSPAQNYCAWPHHKFRRKAAT